MTPSEHVLVPSSPRADPPSEAMVSPPSGLGKWVGLGQALVPDSHLKVRSGAAVPVQGAAVPILPRKAVSGRRPKLPSDRPI